MGVYLMYDFHLHSEYSIDSKTSMEDMVVSAIEKNLKAICFTDHVDFDCSSKGLDFVFRPSDYFRNIKQVKYKYMRDIEILAGVEIGIQPHLIHRYNKFIEDNDFDFILLAIHSLGRKDIHFDNIAADLAPLKALELYYKEMYECIHDFSNFDVLAHIDYMDRYFKDYSALPKFDEYSHLVEDILKLLISKGKGIEINTAGIRYGLSYSHPKIQILRLYKELGGEIITIGSDAHSKDDVGYGYRNAEKLLRDLGFKYIHIFKDRKKFPINIT